MPTRVDTFRASAPAPARAARGVPRDVQLLLNPVWDGDALRLRREPLPIDVDDALSTEAFRAIVPRTIDGHFYPFR